MKLNKIPGEATIKETVTPEVKKEATLAIQEVGAGQVSEVLEGNVEADPRLAAFKEQYEALSDAERTCQGKVRTWDEVFGAIPNKADFLDGTTTLTDAQVYFLNEEGQLVLGDGCTEPSRETLGLDYNRSRTNATRISYIDGEGMVIVVDGDKTEISTGAKVLTERGIITMEEYKRKNKGQFELQNYTWTEAGKGPLVAYAANWDYENVSSEEFAPHGVDVFRGSRCVLRVNLKFGS